MTNPADTNTILNFDSLREANMSRVARWFPGENAEASIKKWNPDQWLLAASGEHGESASAVIDLLLTHSGVTAKLGEAANAMKKMWRVEQGVANKSEAGRQIDTYEQAREKIADEMADTIVYLDLCAARMGISLSDAVKRVFNRTSQKYGFPERIGSHSVYLDVSSQSVQRDVHRELAEGANGVTPRSEKLSEGT